jgi:toxin-antitoxin system PIN domain toxin
LKIPDVNLLIYAHDESSPFHKKAKLWFRSALAEISDPIAISTSACLAFIRLVCNPKVMESPLSISQACGLVSGWFKSGAIVVEASAESYEVLADLMNSAFGGLNLLMDAHLAAIAIENRAVLYSNDRDFQRFSGLKLKNPLD